MQNSFKLAALLVCLFLACSSAAAQRLPGWPPLPKGAPAGAKIRLYPDKPRYFLGENVLLHYEVRNTGDTPFEIEFGGDYRGSPRHLRFAVTAKDEAGAQLEDPTPHPECFGGIGGQHTIKPGETYFDCIPLTRYVVLNKPGKFTVRAANDLGWTVLGEKGQVKEDDARWASTEVEMVMPNAEQAADVVSTMMSLPDSSGSIGKKREPYPDFVCLSDPIYLPHMRRLVDRGDTRAFLSLQNMRSSEATRAIVDALNSSNPELVKAAAGALTARLPQISYTYFDKEEAARRLELAKQTWREEFAEPVLAYADLTLSTTPETSTRDKRMEQAALLLSGLGSPAGLPIVTRALDRALKRSQEWPIESPDSYGNISCLQEAAAAILSHGAKPPEKPQTPGEIAVYLEAVKRAKDRPAACDTYLQNWITHPIAYVQRLVIDALPTPCPTWAIERLRESIQSPDLGIRYAAVQAIGRTKDVSFGPALLGLIATGDSDICKTASYAAWQAGVPLDGVLLAWAQRLDHPDPPNKTGAGDFFETMSQLIAVLDNQGCGTANGTPAPLTPAERTELKSRWIAFIAKNRDAIRAGRRFKQSDAQFQADLIPRVFSVHFKE